MRLTGMEQTNSVPPVSMDYWILYVLILSWLYSWGVRCMAWRIVSVGEAGEAVDSKVLQICVIISCQGWPRPPSTRPPPAGYGVQFTSPELNRSGNWNKYYKCSNLIAGQLIKGSKSKLKDRTKDLQNDINYKCSVVSVSHPSQHHSWPTYNNVRWTHFQSLKDRQMKYRVFHRQWAAHVMGSWWYGHL